jgi:hypothetical protein
MNCFLTDRMRDALTYMLRHNGRAMTAKGRDRLTLDALARRGLVAPSRGHALIYQLTLDGRIVAGKIERARR